MRQYQDPMDMGDDTPHRLPTLPSSLLISIALLVVAVVYWLWLNDRDYLACISICGIAIGAISGFRHGLLRILATLASLALACWFTPTLAGPLETQLAAMAGTSGLLNRFLVYTACGSTIFVAFSFISAILLRLVFGKSNGQAGIDNWLGFFMGGLQVTAAFLLVFGGLLTAEHLHDRVPTAQNATQETAQATTQAGAQAQLDQSVANELATSEIESAETSPLAEEAETIGPAQDVPNEDQLVVGSNESNAVEIAASEDSISKRPIAEASDVEDGLAADGRSKDFYTNFANDLGSMADIIMVRAKESRIAPIIRTLNPFKHVEQLNRFHDVHRTVAVLSSPPQMKKLINAPTFAALKEEPETKTLADEVLAAPEIRELYSSDDGFTTTKVIAILKSPVVLKILDEPKIIQRARDVIGAEAL